MVPYSILVGSCPVSSGRLPSGGSQVVDSESHRDRLVSPLKSGWSPFFRTNSLPCITRVNNLLSSLFLELSQTLCQKRQTIFNSAIPLALPRSAGPKPRWRKMENCCKAFSFCIRSFGIQKTFSLLAQKIKVFILYSPDDCEVGWTVSPPSPGRGCRPNLQHLPSDLSVIIRSRSYILQQRRAPFLDVCETDGRTLLLDAPCSFWFTVFHK